MNIRNEAQLSRYFDRQMTMTEEQNFLIALAASNELRLAFRSQLELMKAIRDDKHEMRPIAEVRSRTIAALGLTAVATAPFLEQALLHSNTTAAQAAEPVLEAAPKATSFFSTLAGKFAIIGSSIASGFLAATLIFNSGTAPQTNTAATPEQTKSAQSVQKEPAVTAAPVLNSPTSENKNAAIRTRPAQRTSEATPLTASRSTQHDSSSTTLPHKTDGLVTPSGTMEIQTSSEKVPVTK